MLNVETRICPHCGHTSTATDPVVERLCYIGGRGLVPVTECRDQTKCWDRWNAANNWPTFEEMTWRDAEQEVQYRRRNS